MSVIIPLYNAERYIADCLNSVLAQTFDNYEVIVVDDCSTDNSAAIVESSKEKFGGRLSLLRTEENSGGGAIPRNKGLLLSRGEYVFFMDSDDKFASATVLAEIFTLAKKFNADLVHCTKSYEAYDDGSHVQLMCNKAYNPTEEILLDENLSWRIQCILEDKIWYAPWRYFIKRDLMTEHNLFFPKLKTAEDQIFGRALLFHAKRLLIVPYAFYFYRKSENSITRIKKDLKQHAAIFLEPITIGLKWLENVMRKIPFFQANPEYSLKILRHFALARIATFMPLFSELSFSDIHKLLKHVFGDKLGEYDVLVAALCTFINMQQENSLINQQKFNQFVVKAQKESEMNRRRYIELAAQVQLIIDDLEKKTK